MTKKLTIVRHAKSDWGNASLKDFDRPLNKRGLRDAPEMAMMFDNRVSDVDYILSSPALRAKTTALTFSKVLGFTEDQLHFNQRIYHAHHETLFEIINQISNEFSHVMLFGHNPGLSDLGTLLTNDYLNFPTCAILEAELHINSWAEVSPDTGSILNFDYPKKYDHLQ